MSPKTPQLRLGRLQFRASILDPVRRRGPNAVNNVAIAVDEAQEQLFEDDLFGSGFEVGKHRLSLRRCCRSFSGSSVTGIKELPISNTLN